MKTDFLKHLASQLSSALPSQLEGLKHDFEKTSQSILTKAFNQFELVTREEFDAQTKVLARTRQKLEVLETQVKTLEEQLKAHPKN